MGNCFRRCLGEDSTSDQISYGGHHPGHHAQAQGGPGGAHHPRPPSTFSYNVVGFTAVARDLYNFETTHRVPSALKEYVTASKATQIIWYEKLLAVWKRAKPAPATAEEVAVLIIQTLQGYQNFQGLLEFYRLPWPKVSKPPSKPAPEVIVLPGPKVSKPPRKPAPEVIVLPGPKVSKPPRKPVPEVIVLPEAGGTWPADVEYEIHTLPVEERAVGDGDGMTVYVDVYKDAREKDSLPSEIQDAVHRRRDARAKGDSKTADALQRLIENADYRVFDAKHGGIQCLARKYRIRLKGVDAPEIGQRYGEESKAKLNDLVKGHPLVIHVYDIDQYGRALGDVHRNGIFIQEALLKDGCVWHYKQFDKRQDFAQWERDAKAACRGLWADIDPEKPWDYRRKHRRSKGRPARKRGA